MLHIRLLEMEAELIAREQIKRAESDAGRPLSEKSLFYLQEIVNEVGLQLAQPCASDFRGWLTYTRKGTRGAGSSDLVLLRGKSFKEGGLFGKHRAGLDVVNGLDHALEYLRNIDVTPPAELDHLLINFGRGKDNQDHVFIWYGENVAPYRLIFEHRVDDLSLETLHSALGQGLHWILSKPRDTTLPQYLQSLKS